MNFACPTESLQSSLFTRPLHIVSSDSMFFNIHPAVSEVVAKERPEMGPQRRRF